VIEPLSGLVGSPTDLATLVLVSYLALRERPRYRRLRAFVVALARHVEGVHAERAQGELAVDDRDVAARTRTDGGRERDR
jgi:hypothetical protein